MLEPFGNDVVVPSDLGETVFRASHDAYDAIILTASDTDGVAAAPGVKSPILALVGRGERAPAGAHEVLEWPASASALHAALATLEARAQDNSETAVETNRGPLDSAAMTALEKSVGTKTLIEILQAYIQTAEQLCRSLGNASDTANWDEAARAAQDIAGSAGALGLTAMTASARGFASAAREGETPDDLRARAQDVIAEHAHVRRALENLYPDLAA